MKISARNQLKGIVEAIDLGVVTAKVSLRVGENLIESVITRQSVENSGSGWAPKQRPSLNQLKSC